MTHSYDLPGVGLSLTGAKRNAHADQDAQLPLLGMLPAMFDPSFGDRVQPDSNLARLLRAMYVARPAFPASWTLQELRAFPAVAERVAGTATTLATTVRRLREHGCLRAIVISQNSVRYGLMPLPPVPVRVETTGGGLKRIAAWLIYLESHLKNSDVQSSLVTASRVHELLAEHGIPFSRKRVTGILRALTEADPAFWSLSVGETSGRLGVSLRDDAGRPASTQFNASTERLLPEIRRRVNAAVPPMCCLSDFSSSDLHALLPGVIEPRKIARGALTQLAIPRKEAIVDLGVFEHRRWFTLPEFSIVASACLQLQRAETNLGNTETEVRAILRCPIDAVRHLRLSEVRRRIACAEHAVESARLQVDSKTATWINRKTHELSCRITKIQRTIATAELGGITFSSQIADAGLAPSLYAWTQLLGEAGALVAHWGSGLGAKALALRVGRRARRVEQVDAPGKRAARVGATGGYHAFEVRALLLSFVADGHTRRIVRRALRSLGACPSVSALRAGLAQPQVEARLLAVMGLGIIGESDDVEELLKVALNDAEAGVRELSLWALALLAPERAAEALVVCRPVLQPEGKQRAHKWVTQQEKRGMVRWSALSMSTWKQKR